MIKTFSKKIPGGKLLNIHLNILNDKISIKITGDFFLYPEDKLWDLEKSLNGLDKNISFDELVLIIKRTFKDNNITIMGFSSVDLSNCIMEAIKLNQE